MTFDPGQFMRSAREILGVILGVALRIFDGILTVLQIFK